MSESKTIVAGVFALALLFSAGAGLYATNQSQVQAAGECDTNSIVSGGVHSYGQLTQKYNANLCGDFRAIYDHYWIKSTLQAGDRAVMGTSNNRGEVVAEGRVVAKNASSIGRTPINYSHPISIAGRTYYETSHVNGQAFANPNSQLQTLVILDKAGNFKYAVITACGNPIYATPVAPPKPPTPPQPKDISVCDLTTLKVITIKENQFDASKHSKNLADCKPKTLQVCDLSTKKVITITESQFDSTKHSKVLSDCVEKPNNIKVCDLATKTVITIDEKMFDSSKYSRNLADCTPPTPVTPVSTPPAPQPTPAPAQLPVTGAGDLLTGGIGIASTSLAIYYYAMSRRNLF